MAGKCWCSEVRMSLLHSKSYSTDKAVVEDHPKGYPQLAAFANSDDNFLMCRRFGFLHNRVLLYRQDELSELEKDLIRIDKCDEEENPVVLTSRSRDDEDDDPQFSRKVLINKIDAKLKDYGSRPDCFPEQDISDLKI